MQHGERTHHRHRHGQQRNDGGAPGLQEQDHHHHDQGHGFQQGLDHGLDRSPHELRGIVGNAELHAFRHVLLQLGHGGAHIGRDFQGIRTRSLEHAHAHSGVVVEQGAQRIIGRAQLQPGHVTQAHNLRGWGAVGAGLDDDVSELFLGLQAALRVDGQLHVHTGQAGRGADHAGCGLHVLAANGGHHVGGRETALCHLLGVQPGAHGIVAAAEDLHLAHTLDARQTVLHIEHGIVAQIVDVIAAVGRNHVHDHGQVGRTLDRGDAQAAHFLGQARLGLGDAVLHQLLRLVGVGAQREGHGQRHHAVGRGLAAHIEHAFHAVDGFLQRRGHGFGNHLGIGARVLGANHHRGWSDLGVFRDRQRSHGDQASEKDEHRQHTREDRAVDEKSGKVHGVGGLRVLRPWVAWRRRDHRPARPWRSWARPGARPPRRGAHAAVR